MEKRPVIEIYIEENCPDCDKMIDVLNTRDIEYIEYDLTDDEKLFEEMRERTGGQQTTPQLFVDDELIDNWDDLEILKDRLGIAAEDDIIEHRQVIVAGTGIAGLTAAIYAARANNEPLIFEGDEPGGQLTLTTDVANYPGFPEGVGGPELIERMKQQAQRFGATLENGVIDTVDDDHPLRVELTNGDVYTTDAFIAASGASARTLGVPGENLLMGYGVSTCATCDGAFFRGEDMLVVGGGDAAFEEAHFLTKFADTVYLVHRREGFRAESYWLDRLTEKVEVDEVEIMTNTELLEIHGTQENGVEYVTLGRHPEGYPKRKLDDPETADTVETFDFDVSAVFLAIGHTPNTGYLENTDVELDADGYIQTAGGRGSGQTRTDVPGLFGAGDVVDFYYQQAITAGGMGCKAAIDVDEYLEALGPADGGPTVESRNENEATADD